MRLRGTPPSLIIDAYIALQKRGRSVGTAIVETVYLANPSSAMTPGDLVELVELELASADGSAS
jgi:hypothetical protein